MGLCDLYFRGATLASRLHYNLIYREEEREMNPLSQAEGVGLVPWSLLARGFLAGNRQRLGGPDHRGDQAISSGAKPVRP
jgi:aryl-alcohol dehydrogenase (NADP+)